MSATCPPEIGHLYDTIILGSYDNEWVVLMHQSASDGNSWTLISTTLRGSDTVFDLFWPHKKKVTFQLKPGKSENSGLLR